MPGEPEKKARKDRAYSPAKAGGAGPQSVGGGERRGFFEVYKNGQGSNTRVWSGLGFGALVCWLAYFLYDKLSIIGTGSQSQIIQVGVAVGVVAVFGILLYWLLGRYKRTCDFLIATEGEMKKVNWSTRKDIIGSTKVVIFVLVSMSIMLFVVDIVFMSFFNLIGVLKGADIIEAIKGMF